MAMDSTLEPESEVKIKNEDQISSRHTEVMDQNYDVVKNDDSDGHVNWTWKQIVATISLCGVYVGKYSWLSGIELDCSSRMSCANNRVRDRLPDSPVLCGR